MSFAGNSASADIARPVSATIETARADILKRKALNKPPEGFSLGFFTRNLALCQ